MNEIKISLLERVGRVCNRKRYSVIKKKKKVLPRRKASRMTRDYCVGKIALEKIFHISREMTMETGSGRTLQKIKEDGRGSVAWRYIRF